MRPDPQQAPERDESGRIIDLGVVRRKRGMRRMAPDRHYLAAFGLVALLAWIAWATVLLTLAPARLLTYTAFFIPLLVALGATGAIGAYAVQWWRGEFPSMMRSGIRGGLFAAVVVTNAAFQAGHNWSPVVLVASIGVALLADAVVRLRTR